MKCSSLLYGSLRFWLPLLCVAGLTATSRAETGTVSHHVQVSGTHYGYDTASVLWVYSGANGTYHVQFDGVGGFGVVTCSSGVCSPTSTGSSVAGVDETHPITKSILVQETGAVITSIHTMVAVDYFAPDNHGPTTNVENTVNVNLSGSPSPSPTPEVSCNWSITATLTSRCHTGTIGGTTVTLSVNGVNRYGTPTTIPAGFTGGTLDFDGSDPSGSVVSLTIGDANSTHTVICFGDPHPSNDWSLVASIGNACNATPSPNPSSTPGATPPATPPPNPSPGPSHPPPGTPGPPPKATPPPGGGTPQNTHVTNAEEFYEPVRRAVRDSGNDSGYTAQSKGAVAKEELGDGHIGDVTAQVETIGTSVKDLKDQLATFKDGYKSKIEGLASEAASIGSACSVTLPITGWIADRLHINQFKVDLCPYGTFITVFRQILLVGITLTFVMLTIRAVQYYS